MPFPIPLEIPWEIKGVRNGGNHVVAKGKKKFTKHDRSLNGINLLQEAAPKKIAEFEKSCQWLEFGADEVVIDAEDESTDVFFVIKGKLRAMDFTSVDEKISLAELLPGFSFGELSAVDLKVRSARVTTIEPTLLASLSSKDFCHLLTDCPEIALTLLKTFAGYVRTLNTRIMALSTMTPHQRIYRELLRISEPDTHGDGSWIITNAPNHSELASWVGAEKQTVAEAIGKLVRDGVIVRKHKDLRIKDHARLLRLVSQ